MGDFYTGKRQGYSSPDITADRGEETQCSERQASSSLGNRPIGALLVARERWT